MKKGFLISTLAVGFSVMSMFAPSAVAGEACEGIQHTTGKGASTYQVGNGFCCDCDADSQSCTCDKKISG